jgi:hypothetical protein
MSTKYLCIYNTITRKIENALEVDSEALVSSELKDWFCFHSHEEAEPLLWEYERDLYARGAMGQGSSNGYVAYCGDVAFSWETYDVITE